MAIETVPITENLYSLAMALMREGLEIEGLQREVDSICDATEYSEDG